MERMKAHPQLKDYLRGLKPRRKAAGLTQADLAREIGTTKESIRAWESGLYWPSAQHLPGMAQALACRIEELYQPPKAPEREGSHEQI